MIKKVIEFIRDGAVLICGSLFTLVAAPIIHWSGMDNADSCPSREDIEKANQFAKQLSGEQSK